MFVTISVKIEEVVITREFSDSECVYDIIEKLKFSLQLPEKKDYILINEKENKFLPKNSELRACPVDYRNLKLLEVGKDVIPMRSAIQA